ncbi:hypothetical protein ABF226_001007 [Flavobacterium psychrophilum]
MKPSKSNIKEKLIEFLNAFSNNELHIIEELNAFLEKTFSKYEDLFYKIVSNLLNYQVVYVSEDKPQVLRKFKKDLLKNLKFPFKYKKLIYFDNILIRDYIFKAHTIVYFANEPKKYSRSFRIY